MNPPQLFDLLISFDWNSATKCRPFSRLYIDELQRLLEITEHIQKITEHIQEITIQDYYLGKYYHYFTGED